MNKAEALSQQFSSVFNIDSQDEILPTCDTPNFTKINNITFTAKGVEKLLRNLKPGKAAGPDNLPARVLKELHKEIAKPLANLFQQSYDTGTMPDDWRKAMITALYKKGNKQDPANYRPVSLTSIICKTMEHIMFSAIANHLEDNKILTFRQHGFRPGFSCVTQLITAVHDWASILEERGQCDVVLLDFSKAFDLVSHARLYIKLKNYGINGNTLSWIKAFLANRKQVVVVNGTSSQPANVTSGVPQGTVLGPLLFLIYINDIAKEIASDIRLFADDSILYRQVLTMEDHIILQRDLHRLEEWARTWKMKFNVKKCAVMSITNKRKPSTYNYLLDNENIPRVRSHDYLGIKVTDDLKWNLHYDHILKKAKQSLGMVRRNLYSCSKEVKVHAYTTLVRPKLEYASETWSPQTSKYIKKLEMVQHAAARYCFRNYSRSQSVTELINRLQWDSLETRRKLADLKMFYKIENIMKINFPSAIQPIPYTTTRRQHPYTKFIPISTINSYRQLFHQNFTAME